MQDNVISIKSRQPISTADIAQEPITAGNSANAHLLDTLDKLRSLVVRGEIESFSLIGRSPRGAYLTELAMPEEIQPETILSYIGAMECLKLELTDLGQGLPQMLLDGTVVSMTEVQ